MVAMKLNETLIGVDSKESGKHQKGDSQRQQISKCFIVIGANKYDHKYREMQHQEKFCFMMGKITVDLSANEN